MERRKQGRHRERLSREQVYVCQGKPGRTMHTRLPKQESTA